jgi:radical SAM protein with 4Fe4S-binding SPASM domain
VLILRAPTVAYIQVSGTCNYRCPGCCIHGPGEKKISLDNWRIILERALPYLQEVRIFGGEPSILEDLFSLLDMIQARRVIFSIFSNGLWPSPETYIRRLASYSCLDRLAISLVGLDELSHDGYSGVPGSFVQVKKNIFQAIMGGLRVQLHYRVTRHTAGRLDSLCALARGIGVESLVLGRYHCLAPRDASEPGSEEWPAILEEVASLQHPSLSLAYDSCLPPCMTSRDSAGCFAGISIAAIDPWGNIHPCHRDTSLWGNVLHAPLEDIWKSGAASFWRKKPLPSACTACRMAGQCFGGCHCTGDRDPLIVGSEKPRDAALPGEAPVVKLDGALRPVGDFSVRKEQFGFALIKGAVVIPTSQKFASIIGLLDGKHRLSEICSLAGDEMLSFLYSLHERDFVFFV